MANIYLHALDRWWSDRHTGVGRLYRYCDDFVVVCRSRRQAEQARALITGFLGRLKLTLHPGKTQVVDLGVGGFEFLGFHFHKKPSKRTGRLVPYAWPSQKAMKTIRAKLRPQTEKTQLRVELGELVGSVNRIIVGWRAYFSIENATKKLTDLDRYVRLRMRRFLKKRQGPRGSVPAERLPGVGAPEWSGVLLPTRTRPITALHAVRRRLSESRMRENLTYGLMWQGVETRAQWSPAPLPGPTSRRIALAFRPLECQG